MFSAWYNYISTMAGDYAPVVFVTGGAGFVGSHMILELLNSGYEVVTVDNFHNAIKGSTGKPESIRRIEEITGKEITFYEVDITNKEEISNILSKHKCDCVIHLAALKAVGESVEKPFDYYQTNVNGTLVLLEAMRSVNIRNLVYSSSCTVYGAPQFLPLTEDHPTGIGCTNPYAHSKVFTEQIMKDVAKSDDSWRIILLRYFNPVGAHESGRIGEDPRGEPQNLMPYVSQVAVGRYPQVKVFGSDYNTVDGSGVRDYLHVMDVASGHVKAIDKLFNKEFKGCREYNLGTGQGSSTLQVIEAFKKASGKDVPYVLTERREGDLEEVYADCKRAREELGWEATRDINKICEDVWRWQSTNPNGYADSS